MCQTAVGLIGKALVGVNNADVIMKIKKLISLFMQTMDVSFTELQTRCDVDDFGRAGVSALELSIDSFLHYLKNTRSFSRPDLALIFKKYTSCSLWIVPLTDSGNRSCRRMTTCPCRFRMRMNSTRSSTSAGIRQRNLEKNRRKSRPR